MEGGEVGEVGGWEEGSGGSQYRKKVIKHKKTKINDKTSITLKRNPEFNQPVRLRISAPRNMVAPPIIPLPKNAHNKTTNLPRIAAAPAGKTLQQDHNNCGVFEKLYQCYAERELC